MREGERRRGLGGGDDGGKGEAADVLKSSQPLGM